MLQHRSLSFCCLFPAALALIRSAAIFALIFKRGNPALVRVAPISSSAMPPAVASATITRLVVAPRPCATIGARAPTATPISQFYPAQFYSEPLSSAHAL